MKKDQTLCAVWRGATRHTRDQTFVCCLCAPPTLTREAASKGACALEQREIAMPDRALYPLEKRMDGQPGILTARRMPHHWPGDTARKPLPRQFNHVRQPAEVGPDHWEKAVMRQHRRWDAKTGAVVRKAEEAAIRAEPVGFDDELDQLVRIQVERQRRLRSLRSAPPVVHRLLHPPPPPPKPLDPLDEFMAFVNKGNGCAGTRNFVAPQRPGVNVPHTRKGAFGGLMSPTKSGLYHAIPDF